MCWPACETYWFALQDICCFLWYKLSNTKRVNRRRRRHLRHRQFQDIEEGYSSSGDNDLWDDYHNLNVSRKRKSLSRRRRDRVQRSVHPSSRHGSRSHHHQHVRLKTRMLGLGFFFSPWFRSRERERLQFVDRSKIKELTDRSKIKFVTLFGVKLC
ncbi:hypothetical protein ACLB2K_067059 [Fragaria x ananassa]